MWVGDAGEHQPIDTSGGYQCKGQQKQLGYKWPDDKRQIWLQRLDVSCLDTFMTAIVRGQHVHAAGGKHKLGPSSTSKIPVLIWCLFGDPSRLPRTSESSLMGFGGG